MYFTYILGCLDTRRTYAGHTDDLIRRYTMHCEGSTRTTRERFVRPVMLYFEVYSTRTEAVRRERYFKQGSGHRLRLRIANDAFKVFNE